MLRTTTPSTIQPLQTFNFNINKQTDICLLKMTVEGSEKHALALMNSTDQIFDKAKEAGEMEREAVGNALETNVKGEEAIRDWVWKFFVFHRAYQRNKGDF